MADDSTDTITGLMSGIPDIIKKIPGLLNQAPAAAKAIGGRLLEAAPYAALVPALAQGDQGAFALAASMQERKQQSAQQAMERQALELFARQHGLLGENEPLPPGINLQSLIAVKYPKKEKQWVPMGKGGMFNLDTGEVKGAPTGTDIPKGELEKLQWIDQNPNDPRVPYVKKALDEQQARRVEAVGGTTKARLEAKRGATTIGDTKDTWIANKGPYAGQKIPADTPLPVAESMGTKLSALEAKGYEGTQELLGWMKELGITPDGQISPEGQARFERLYATKPGVFRTIWNSVTRGKKLISGDPDAALVHQAVSVLTTQFAKATAGTLRVNQSELRLIKAAHPEWTDTAETAIDKLKRVTRYAAAVQQRMLGGTPAPPEDAPPFMPSLLSPGSSLPAPVTIPSDRANLFAP